MHSRKFRIAVSVIGLVALLGCADATVVASDLPSVTGRTEDIDRFAIGVLGSLQARSIAESREYCGAIFESPDGGLATSPIARGTEASCDIKFSALPVVAWFHTHGSFSPRYDNEVPSVEDVEGDFNARIDGYVATPAGRVWLIDYETGIIRQLCGRGCITADPNDDPRAALPVPQSLTLAELRARLD